MRLIAGFRRLGLVRRVIVLGVLGAILGVALVGAGVAVAAIYGTYGFHPAENARSWAALTPRYGDPTMCAACHVKEYASWTKAKHVAVTCESCHGPLAAHAARPERHAGGRRPDRGPVPDLPREGDRAPLDPAPGRPRGALPGGHLPPVSQRPHIPGRGARPPGQPLLWRTCPACATCHGPAGLNRFPAGHVVAEDSVCLGVPPARAGEPVDQEQPRCPERALAGRRRGGRHARPATPGLGRQAPLRPAMPWPRPRRESAAARPACRGATSCAAPSSPRAGRIEPGRRRGRGRGSGPDPRGVGRSGSRRGRLARRHRCRPAVRPGRAPLGVRRATRRRASAAATASSPASSRTTSRRSREFNRTWVERHVVGEDGTILVDSPDAGMHGFRRRRPLRARERRPVTDAYFVPATVHAVREPAVRRRSARSAPPIRNGGRRDPRRRDALHRLRLLRRRLPLRRALPRARGRAHADGRRRRRRQVHLLLPPDHAGPAARLRRGLPVEARDLRRPQRPGQPVSVALREPRVARPAARARDEAARLTTSASRTEAGVMVVRVAGRARDRSTRGRLARPSGRESPASRARCGVARVPAAL